MVIKTKVAIIVPNPDLAAKNIWLSLRDRSFFKKSDETFDESIVYHSVNYPNDIKLFHSKRDGVESNHLENEIDTELFIFASRHRSASGTPSLLIHPTGNWSTVTLGGRDDELSFTSAYVLRVGLMKLVEKKEKYGLNEFKVDLEVTHHGPTKMKTPLCFVELGSNEQYWKHEKGAIAVGESIIETAKIYVKNYNSFFSDNVFVGFGGNHYAYRFHKQLMENENLYVGHMAPKHSIDKLTKELAMQAFEKTKEKPKIAMIDKKGVTSPQRKKIIDIVEKLGKEYIIV